MNLRKARGTLYCSLRRDFIIRSGGHHLHLHQSKRVLTSIKERAFPLSDPISSSVADADYPSSLNSGRITEVPTDNGCGFYLISSPEIAELFTLVSLIQEAYGRP
ncbi:hypothetical protein J5N97_003273 [Dioscorea zingiberensis]|uniref:Uncharacterized protein n=1 Tax=Dioscorea zingiberensis TaxID=325984 RepID=A0A9D5HR41_9LILI|nr:hypothetical protein J5N97_003273 [Dioscorea zingiberensis]